MAGDKGRGGTLKLDEPMVHSCGRSFDQANTYAIHAKHCDGKPQTRGRIERLSARRTRPLPAVITAKPREVHADRTPPAIPGVPSIAAAATDQAIVVVIAGLRARRAQLDTAIAVLEALS